MNKLIKYSAPVLAVLATACQTMPNLAVYDPSSVARSVAVQPVALQPAEPEKVEAKVKEPASMITPMLERQSTIRATGYAVISTQNHKNAAQQRLLAIRASKLDAYRALTEQVYGQQLDATTTIAEMMVTSDTFRTRVEGVIYGAVLESITPVGDDTYETSMSLDGRVVSDLRVLYLTQLASRGR